MRFAMLAALLSLGFVAPLNAARFFVDYAGGTDANSGTSADSPWKHCPGDPAATDAAAAQSLTAGDTVVFKGGVSYVFTATTGIQLRWDGAVGQAITYDGNSDEGWGSGRAQFTDSFGASSVTAFFATEARHDLAFRHLDVGAIGGAPSVPDDAGSPVAARYGGGIGFSGAASGVLIEDCTFHELGYWFVSRPMSAASLAGTAISAADCDGLKISRCDFSRVAVGCELSHATQIDRFELVDCRFHDSIVWPVNLPASVSPDAITVRGCSELDLAQFDSNSWTGYGHSPRLQTATVVAGQRVVLTASALAAPVPAFQWRKDGIPLSGATDSTLTLDAPTSADSGLYTVVAANALGAASSSGFALFVTPFANGDPIAGQTDTAGIPLDPTVAEPTGQTANLAPAVSISPSNQIVSPLTTATFVATVSGGPATALQWRKNGVPLAGATDATLTLASLTTNDEATYSVVAANEFGYAVSNEATLSVASVAAPAPAGVDPALTGPGKTLLGVGAGPAVFTFTVEGTAPRTMLVRAVGPSLAGLGLTGVLGDPELRIFSGESVVSQNDNWGGLDYFRSLFSQVGAFPLADSSSRDSTLIVALNPGTYTAVVEGVNGATGMVLVEVFPLP